jgi:acyl carrier protein
MGVNTLELVKDFLAQRLEVPSEKVVPEALLDDLGVDSLMFAEMLFEFEDRTHASIDITSADALPVTVGELVALIDAHLSEAAPASGGSSPPASS